MTVEVDCTPEEARRFLGLPDVAPLHAAMLERMQAQVAEMTASPEAMLAAWTRMAQPGWMGDAMGALFKSATKPSTENKP
ncbi:MAG: hypothetical protein JWO26_2975 [Rhodospirillales bacterium]|jgi:hypothetical protein|nr:hypothetical protein [Rhodospirillales bacterium]MDB5383343.1 hypothetical protein [Rhodospirillales bacterium]